MDWQHHREHTAAAQSLLEIRRERRLEPIVIQPDEADRGTVKIWLALPA